MGIGIRQLYTALPKVVEATEEFGPGEHEQEIRIALTHAGVIVLRDHYGIPQSAKPFFQNTLVYDTPHYDLFANRCHGRVRYERGKRIACAKGRRDESAPDRVCDRPQVEEELTPEEALALEHHEVGFVKLLRKKRERDLTRDQHKLLDRFNELAPHQRLYTRGRIQNYRLSFRRIMVIEDVTWPVRIHLDQLLDGGCRGEWEPTVPVSLRQLRQLDRGVKAELAALNIPAMAAQGKNAEVMDWAVDAVERRHGR
jgi:hypothetical protein